MRPKTFPASNYSGSSRQMLQEIRESLRNLSKPSDAAKAEHNLNKMSTEDPRQVRNPPKFGTHHKALQEIRNSLLPFANETSSSRIPSEVNPQMFQDLQAAGFDEVRTFKTKIKRNKKPTNGFSYPVRKQLPGEFIRKFLLRRLNCTFKFVCSINKGYYINNLTD